MNFLTFLKSMRILFIGTVPIELTTEEPEEYRVINNNRVYNADYFQKNDRRRNGASNFRNVKKFVEKYPTLDYNFLLRITKDKCGNESTGMSGVIDENYRNKILNYNLIPDNKMKILPNLPKYDIVYIDSSTLGFIDYKETANGWIDFFKPLMKKSGCMIIDDTDVFKHECGIKSYLGTSIHNGLTSRFYSNSLQFKNQILSDFMNIVVRFNIAPVILFDYGMETIDDMEKFMKRKRTWDLVIS